MRLLAAILVPTLALAGGESFEVKVTPPDMIFTFSRRVEVPGRPKLALVLSGGGARGVAHIGVLQRMEEIGVPIDGVAGTSAGALMGALMAAGSRGWRSRNSSPGLISTGPSWIHWGAARAGRCRRTKRRTAP